MKSLALSFSPNSYCVPASPLTLTLEAARVLLLYFKAILWLPCQKKA